MDSTEDGTFDAAGICGTWRAGGSRTVNYVDEPDDSGRDEALC